MIRGPGRRPIEARPAGAVDVCDELLEEHDPVGLVVLGGVAPLAPPDGDELAPAHLAAGRSGRRLFGAGFHDLRRLAATTLVVSGVDVKTAQVRLGHSDPRMTLAVYASSPVEADRAAAPNAPRTRISRGADPG